MDLITVGGRVQKWREERGWTRQELALKANLSPPAIGLIEKGQRKKLRPDTWAQLAGAFGVTIAELIGEEAIENPEEPSDAAYQEAIALAKRAGLLPLDLIDMVKLLDRIKRTN